MFQLFWAEEKSFRTFGIGIEIGCSIGIRKTNRAAYQSIGHGLIKGRIFTEGVDRSRGWIGCRNVRIVRRCSTLITLSPTPSLAVDFMVLFWWSERKAAPNLQPKGLSNASWNNYVIYGERERVKRWVGEDRLINSLQCRDYL